MRGKVGALAPEEPRPGITPAYAGKRSGPSCRWSSGRDHPRVCGEKCCVVHVFVTEEGSPPRMRGKVEQQIISILLRGITPAYAGKSQWGPPAGGRERDHPRVCGEKSMVAPSWGPGTGSPPRMRGKVSLIGVTDTAPGITPAYAGKSDAVPPSPALGGDHPRVCGEKYARNGMLFTLRGSPPRMRGKVWCSFSYLAARGITPAYAGKSPLACCPWRLHRDHPRVCGEKHCPKTKHPSQIGSPPRMRGKVFVVALCIDFLRITPAYAGKRKTAWKGEGKKQDHPRVCGEKTIL